MLIPRDIEATFRKLATVYPAIAIVGARQAGKTTFLKAQDKEANYLLFDDPDIRDLFETDIKRFEWQFLEGKEMSILDEAQNCQNAGQKLKYLIDKGRKLWITSSSEVLLGKEVLSYLVGRVSVLRLFPFSLQEYLIAKGQKEFTEKTLQRFIIDHALYGGYPKVVITPETELKKTILGDLYETMILKDVVKTFSLDDFRSLEQFVRYLSLNIGGVISYETIGKTINLSFPTLKKYLNALEKSYLIVSVPPFYKNKNKEISKQPKVYFIDTGLRNIIARDFPLQIGGALFENYVLSELLKMGFSPRYWRTKSHAEVDFIIEKQGEIIPIEVKITADAMNIEHSLLSFITGYRSKHAFVIALQGNYGQKKVDGCTIMTTSLWEARKILLRKAPKPTP